MSDLPVDALGAAWLASTYKIAPVAPLLVLSQAGKRRATEISDGRRLETYPEVMRPAATLAAHLQFHLRYEVVHLEFLARLFGQAGPQPVQTWVESEPTGQYARRAAFLYEWLTGDLLQVPERLAGGYVDAIDPDKQVAASADQIVKVRRWRINDNLPGTRHFCPMVARSEGVDQAMSLDVGQLLMGLREEFGEDLLLRAAAWMTLRESKASFAIEGEGSQATRIQRFADVMARRTGQGVSPLAEAELADLQQQILGKTTLTRFGIRQSPVFVGETSAYQEVVHYVAPVAGDVPEMMAGLRAFLAKTQGQSPVMRSAVAAFGFVYIHPLADGNGRLHRFLINDVLRRDGVVSEPIILPVSAVISADSSERRAYDRILDTVSQPLMEAVRDHVSFSPLHTTYAYGVVSNLAFDGELLARPAWRYPDLGRHVEYLAAILTRTVSEQMRAESRYLRRQARARAALKEVVEMPDVQADRVLRSIEQNDGSLSNVLRKEMPVLDEAGIWEAVVDAVSHAWLLEKEGDPLVAALYGPERSGHR